jgi:hypothetical protein
VHGPARLRLRLSPLGVRRRRWLRRALQVVLRGGRLGDSLRPARVPAYSLQWPFCYHIWSATFGQSPELAAQTRMQRSRAAYIQKWGSHTEETHVKFMSAIPFHHTKWLDPRGPQEAVITAEHGFHQ